MAISAFLEYLQYEKGVSKHTLIAYKTDLHQFEDFIITDAGSFVLAHLDNSDVRRWILHLMSNKITPSTVARKISSLNTFFRYCLRHKLISQNPATGVVLPKKSKRLPSFLKKDEAEALFSQEDKANDFESIRDDLIIEMLIGLGLRRAELCSLSPNSLDLNNRTIKSTRQAQERAHHSSLSKVDDKDHKLSRNTRQNFSKVRKFTIFNQ